jgi:hypothetical protein
MKNKVSIKDERKIRVDSKKKLISITEDMKNIVNNIENNRANMEQVKNTLEVMIKECEEVSSKK